MPELPEVQSVVNSLRLLVGRRIVRTDLRRPDILLPAGVNLARVLMQKRLASVERRAKRIVFQLDDQTRFYIHLGMSGRINLAKPSDAIAKHTHLLLEFDDQTELRFQDARRFGGVWWLGHETDDSNIGPEPLTMRWTSLAAGLARTRRAIKTALLDQTLVAGIGNIYADESLFEARIHPTTPADALTPEQVRRLSKSIKTVLRRALRHRGSTLRDYRDANGNTGSFQRLHRVYDRKDAPCLRCKTPIVRIVLGGRGTHFCPACQIEGC